MSMIASRTRLAALTKDLLGKWAQTQERWQDARSQEFDQKYIEELRASVDAAVSSMEKLDKIVAKVRNDCE